MTERELEEYENIARLAGDLGEFSVKISRSELQHLCDEIRRLRGGLKEIIKYECLDEICGQLAKEVLK